MNGYYCIYTCDRGNAALVRCPARDEYFETGWYESAADAIARADLMATQLGWELEPEDE